MRHPHSHKFYVKFSLFVVCALICFLCQSALVMANEKLLSEKRVKEADSYYQHTLFTQPNTSSSMLEKLERKVNAKQAFDSKDWYGARYSLARVLSDNPADFNAWFLLTRAFIELDQYDSYQDYQSAIDAALTKAYQYALTDVDKAVVLWTIYRLVDDKQYDANEFRQAALKLADTAQIEERIQALLNTYPTEFAPYFMDIPQRSDIASACISWTYPLVKNRSFQYEDYVTLEPKVKDLAVIAKGNKLCLEGLQFGHNYKFTFKAGFPGEGVKLNEEQSLNLYIPHRKPTIRFRERGYVLPAHGPQMIPFVAVNVSKVQLKIIHVPERNIQSIQSQWFSNHIQSWNAQYLKEEQGEVIWEGTYHSKGEMDKTAISGLPIDEIIGKKLIPGVYVVEARVNEHSYDRDEFAAQALVISDIGLSTYKGKDGLHVFARSLHSANPLNGVEVTLVARNNRELAKAHTKANGMVSFSETLLNGKGGNAPAFLTASFEGKQFTALNLRNEAFDLSSHGAAGRAPQGSIDGYITTERGIYRPGETVHFLSLVRDVAGYARTNLPLTLRLYRPDGVIAHESVLQDQGLGSYVLDFPINAQAQSGSWVASIFVDPFAAEIGHTSFQVLDFVPPRIEVKTTSNQERMSPHEHNTVAVKAQYYFGPPGADLHVEAESSLVLAKEPFLAWQNYHFGLEEEQWVPQKFKHAKTKTDEKGQANINAIVDMEPQTSHLLQLETTVTVFEVGGRAQTAKHVTPFWHQPYVIGISPRFKDGVAPINTKAVFDVVALNSQGKLQAKAALRYTLFTEEHDYVWFQTGANWQYEVVTRDRVVANGLLNLEGATPTPFSIPVDSGLYRLEILDEKTGVATSMRFSAGWYQSQEAPDRPDLLEISLEPGKNGKTKINLNSPFEGELFLALAGNNFKPIHNSKVEKGNNSLEIELEKNGATSGDYVLATVFRPGNPKISVMPSRAIGVAWFNSSNTSGDKIDVAIKTPEVIKSNQTLVVEVDLKSLATNSSAKMAIAVVDEATLSLVGYKTPDIYGHFFGQKQLAYELRDSYGLLINPYGTRPGSFEVGGDGPSSRAFAQLGARPYKIVSMFSGVLDTNGQKTLKVPFTLPEFSGKLRVMVLVWDEKSVGSVERAVIVRDEIDMYLALPRFLAPKDTASIPLILRNVDAKEGEYQVRLSSEGNTANKAVHLKKDEEKRVPLKQTFTDTGIKKVEASIQGKEGFSLSRTWEIAVRQKAQSISLTRYGSLEAQKRLVLDSALFSNFQPTNSQVILTVGAVPDLGRAQLIQELKEYPYHCLEQTTSRLLAHAHELEKGDCTNNMQCAKIFAPGFNQLSTLQKYDGSFALWSLTGSTEPWLSLYAADVLTTLEQKGVMVPSAMKANLMNWIKETQQRQLSRKGDVSLVAYAHYLLAKEGKDTFRELRFFADNHEKEIVLRRDCAFIAAAFAYFGEAQLANQWFEKAIVSNSVANTDERQFSSHLRDLALLVALLGETTHVNPKLHLLAQELVAKAQEVKYFSTQEKAWLIRASIALKEAHKNFQASLNGKVYQGNAPLNKRFQFSDLNHPQQLVNEGQTPLYYSLSVVGEPVDLNLLPQSGFEIKREIYTLNGEPISGKFQSGERYVVVVKGERLKEDLHHVLMVDLLPAGFEIEVSKLSDDAVEQHFPWLGKLTPASRIEGRDDRFVAAFELDQKTHFTSAYVIRAVTGGQFTYPAVYVESMYQPQYFKYGKEERIEITQAN
ncbi:MAG: hypothetical protein BGO43_09500 [Gammaproteobacteria bacterium 39-13]|nr:MAG: hypothetical protein BGO43_09500 [Gammaproteobacteria bacterium 39-13]